MPHICAGRRRSHLSNSPAPGRLGARSVAGSCLCRCGYEFYLLVSLGGLSDDLDAVLIELHDGLHHTDCLVKWAIVVVIGERVLLEELIFDNLGGLHREKRKHAKGH